MIPCEIDRRGDVCRIARHHRIGARLRGPCIDPAERLGQSGLISEIERVVDFPFELFGGSALRSALEHIDREGHRDQVPLYLLDQDRPFVWLWPAGVGRSHTPNMRLTGKRIGECSLS